MGPFTPEFRLVLAASAWPKSTARNEAVKLAAAKVRDWPVVQRLLNRHRVVGPVRTALCEAGVAVPEPYAALLNAQAIVTVRDNLAMAAETMRLENAFAAADIAFCFVKGAPLAVQLFGEIGARQSRDIDVLVAPERCIDAYRLIESLGYRRSFPPPELRTEQFDTWTAVMKECEFIHSALGLRLELHWHLVDNPRLLDRLDTWRALESVALGQGTKVTTLSYEAQFAYLCVHGAGHGWSRLKWLVDIAAYAAKAGPDGTAALEASARARGAGRCPAQALLICEALWGPLLPPEYSAHLRGDRRTRWLAAIGLRTLTLGNALTDPNDDPIGLLLTHFSHYLMRGGLPFYLAQMKRGLIGHVDIIELKLPPRLAFLYPLARLPLWGRRQIVRALGARRGKIGVSPRPPEGAS